MQMETELKTEVETVLRACPDCGDQMEPRAIVPSSRHFSRWWHCPNGQCRAEWLLPMFSVEMALSSQSKFSGSGDNGADAQFYWTRKQEQTQEQAS